MVADFVRMIFLRVEGAVVMLKKIHKTIRKREHAEGGRFVAGG
jgi:hypothetical protein